MATSAFRIVTFNAGLAVGVLPYATERLPHVAAAIAGLEADLVFLQETWLETHWDELRGTALERYPYAFRPALTQPAWRGACTKEEIAPLVACAREHCAGLTSDELGRCVLRHCGHLAASLSAACLNCVVSHPVGTLDEIVAPCLHAAEAAGASRASHASHARSARGAAEAAEARAARSRADAATLGYGPAGLVAYGGSLGTAFLSTAPLLDPDVLVYDASTMNARGALYARLASTVLGELHVFGTHLSPGIHEEQTTQIDQLLAWIDEKAGRAPTVIAGDLNTGPSVRGTGSAATSLPSLYRRLADAGFSNPYLDSGAAASTWSSGSLASGLHGRAGWVIDHVLLRGVPGSARGERILDQPLEIRRGGRHVTTAYSDHAGVRVTIEPPRT